MTVKKEKEGKNLDTQSTTTWLFEGCEVIEKQWAGLGCIFYVVGGVVLS